MLALGITEDELRDLVVKRLELLDGTTFDRARASASRLRIPLERALVERGRIPPAFLLAQVAQAWDVGFTELGIADVKTAALRAVSEEYAREHLLLPFERDARTLSVAFWDPRDRRLIDEIQRLTGLTVRPFLAPEAAIRRAQLLYRGDLRDLLERTAARQAEVPGRVARESGERSATELLTRILEYAVVARASDIHIEPYELEGLVRCRLDGVLQEVLALPMAALPPLIARIKILSGMRIDERRAPQDGRFDADLGGFKIDLRVSSMPTLWGEKAVLRVLTKDNVVIDLEDLGLSAGDYEIVLRNIVRPFGMVLLTGPTGSGKTTSLYAMMIRVGAERHNVVNISTIEDPIEYTIPRVNQVPVNASAGVEFASGLRALLRQDPDIIMVGEIRDRDTAEIATRSALVGRLLLSTLHTNDATAAVPRLLDMGIEPYLLASTLALVVAQRLVRRICRACRQSEEPDAGLLATLRRRPDYEAAVLALQREGVLRASADPLGDVRVFRGAGCSQCQGTGFRGRIGVFELFEVDERARTMIMERHDAGTIRAAAIQAGMKTMFQDGLAKAFLGETTIEEVFRVAL